MANPKTRLIVDLDFKLHEEFRQLAADEERSMSTLIRRFIREAVEKGSQR